MCEFFSFITEPEKNGGRRFYFGWDYRKEHLQDENDSHSLICKRFKLKEDVCNKYEFNPLTKAFVVDKVNSPVDDRLQAEDWVNGLDFRRVVEPLIIKPIVNPLNTPRVDVTEEHRQLLKRWASVGASVGASVWDSVWDSVGDSVWDSVWASVRDSVWDSVRDSVWDSMRDSVRVYVSSFLRIEYKYDFTPLIQLWESGLIPSFYGTTWRLHSGKKADIVYQISADELRG